MKYLCKTKCFINRKLYHQDMFYEFAKEPNKHFEYVGAKAAEAKTAKPTRRKAGKRKPVSKVKPAVEPKVVPEPEDKSVLGNLNA